MPAPAITRDMLTHDTIATQHQLLEVFDAPRGVSLQKESVAITDLERAFIEASAFYLLSTASTEGACDVSPRGDSTGAVVVVDERTLVLPDRAGNNRIDSLRNIVANPQVGLLFLVPGCDETLRVNGTASLTTNPALLSALSMHGKAPRLAIVVKTEAVFMHCARAFRRSGLWDPTTWPEPGTVPQMPAILKQKLAMPEPVETIAAQREERYRTTLY